MSAPILIVGQGLAGTMLAWEFVRAGIEFEIVDAGHAGNASRVGAGIINPITGQRLVKSWRIDEWLEDAVRTYRELEVALEGKWVRRMQVRRFFADEKERQIFAEKNKRGELAPYIEDHDERGFLIERAVHVDLRALIERARVWLGQQRRLSERRIPLPEALANYELTILCAGADAEFGALFDFAALAPAKGQLLDLETGEMPRDVILNRGHWILPLAAGGAKVGATYEREFRDLAPTADARTELAQSARGLLANLPFKIRGQSVGVRMTTPDRRPVAGRSPREPRVGIINGLGSKGALLAPRLARQWVNHLTEGVPFDADVDVARFWR